MRDCRQDCRQENGRAQKCTIFSRKTAKTALYHSIKCGNLAESQGFEEPNFGTYALIPYYLIPFCLNDMIFRTFEHSWFLCFQAVKGTCKGIMQPHFSSRFELKTTHPPLFSAPRIGTHRREGQLFPCITACNFPVLDEPFYALINCNASMKTCSCFSFLTQSFHKNLLM